MLVALALTIKVTGRDALLGRLMVACLAVAMFLPIINVRAIYQTHKKLDVSVASLAESGDLGVSPGDDLSPKLHGKYIGDDGTQYDSCRVVSRRGKLKGETREVQLSHLVCTPSLHLISLK